MIDFELLRTNPLDVVVVDFETTPIKKDGNVDKIWMIGWKWIEDDERKCIQLSWPDGITPANLSSLINNVHSRAQIKKHPRDVKLSHLLYILKEKHPAFHNAGFDKRRLDELGIEVNRYIDTMMVAYLMAPPAVLLDNTGDEDNIRLYSLKELGNRGFCRPKLDAPETFEVFTEGLETYNEGDLDSALDIVQNLYPALIADKDLFNCFIEVEMPAIELAMVMSRRGVHIPDDKLDELILECESIIDRTELTLAKYLPIIPNPNKPKEFNRKKLARDVIDEYDKWGWDTLGKFLYVGTNRGKLQYREMIEFNPASSTHKRFALRHLFNWESDRKSRKTGEPTVDKHALTKLGEEVNHPFVDALLENSTYKKLLSGFLVPWKDDRDVDNRIHPSFLAVGTATGRYSSRNPNFQNVPKSIKKAITAQKGNVIVYIDLSQAELRILAYYMAVVLNDYQLWNVYARNEDVHSANMKLMGITDPDKRVIAKRAIFLKIYGGGWRVFAKSCDISEHEAKMYLKRFNEVIPGIPNLMSAVRDAILSSDKGIIRSLKGRRIVYPQYKKYAYSTKKGYNYKRERAFRQYFNAIFQGGNFDISSVLGWEVYPYAVECGGCPIIQVHDSFVFEIPEASAGWFMDILYDKFNTTELLEGLPMTAMPGYGATWEDAEADAKRREDEMKEKVA